MVGKDWMQLVCTEPSLLSSRHPIAPARGRVRGLEKNLERGPQNLRVGIQEQEDPAGAMAKPQVVRPGKTDVLRALDELHPGKLPGGHLSALVVRGVVHHDHLPAWGIGIGEDRSQAFPDESCGVPIHDDDGKVHFSFPSRASGS